MLARFVRSASANSVRASAVRALGSRAASWKVDNPYDGSVYAEVPVVGESSANAVIEKSAATFKTWSRSPMDQRLALLQSFITEFEKQKEKMARDISGQMGRPIGDCRGEVNTAIARARALMAMAPVELKDEPVTTPAGMWYKIGKEAIGPVLSLCPWNYPLLCAVNSVAAAVLSGCTVVLKHSDRTPLCADHFADAFKAAGAPAGLVQTLHADHDVIHKAIGNPNIAYVQFTGSVEGGHRVYESAAKRFIDVGLELGGKDPAYVAEDADLAKAVAGIVDGGMYNAGQSCCAVERVYVHKSKYEDFVAAAKKTAEEYVLGDPLDSKTTLGPLAQPKQPAFLAKQVSEAVAGGARLVTGGKAVTDSKGKGRFFQPTIVADAKQNMSVMKDESFGPLLAIAPVSGDEEAVKMMNDSQFGLTASIWTTDPARAERLGRDVDAGTVYLNRCDFLDPYLPWSGRKDSGKGIGLSRFAFAPFIRTKGYNFRVKQ